MTRHNIKRVRSSCLLLNVLVKNSSPYCGGEVNVTKRLQQVVGIFRQILSAVSFITEACTAEVSVLPPLPKVPSITTVHVSENSVTNHALRTIRDVGKYSYKILPELRFNPIIGYIKGRCSYSRTLIDFVTRESGSLVVHVRVLRTGYCCQFVRGSYAIDAVGRAVRSGISPQSLFALREFCEGKSGSARRHQRKMIEWKFGLVGQLWRIRPP
jgi:hypothetical protein